MKTSCILALAHLPHQADFYNEKRLKLMSDILGVCLKYRRFLSATAPCSEQLAIPLKTIACTIMEAQYVVIKHMQILVQQPNNAPTRSPDRWSLLHSPAFIETATLALAGWCKFMQAKQPLHQQQIASTSSSTRGSTSNSNKGGRSSSSKKKGSSSSSSTTAAPAASPPSNYLQLVVPADHCSFGDGLAQELVSGSAWEKVHGPALLLGQALRVEDGVVPLGGQVLLSSNLTSSHLQLLLETAALAGVHGERLLGSELGGLVGGTVGCVDFLDVLGVAIAAAAVEQRMTFVAARGGLLLQVCRLVLEAGRDVEQLQQQQLQRVPQQKLQRVQKIVHGGRQVVDRILMNCALGTTGEWQLRDAHRS